MVWNLSCLLASVWTLACPKLSFFFSMFFQLQLALNMNFHIIMVVSSCSLPKKVIYNFLWQVVLDWKMPLSMQYSHKVHQNDFMNPNVHHLAACHPCSIWTIVYNTLGGVVYHVCCSPCHSHKWADLCTCIAGLWYIFSKQCPLNDHLGQWFSNRSEIRGCPQCWVSDS